jgi:bifunctional UDP-N-acetylglucosamine pyrophosphorylase / glucosamine-1-phosphate N-acetyltransferase
MLYGDTPFIRPETLAAMLEARATPRHRRAGLRRRRSGRYGRLVMRATA